MSWLLFERDQGTLTLFRGSPNKDFRSSLTGSGFIGKWKAHNIAVISHGPWPNGTWKWGYYKRHLKDQLFQRNRDGTTTAFYPGCFDTPYGCSGIHIFNVPGRPGIGVHAGRETWQQYIDGTPNGKTLGCVRTTEYAMHQINFTHFRDRIVLIVVK